ncbi:alpha/beta fold hydrolase [Sedimentitalea todarodis]|uniref:Maspardin n=1 Tax=Sedimentitalea todarodis TaxID=1631240 RepID=A0ABU3VE35_9RHOB|nr:alpha/beta hydrolase [Sedimentitalea todarodis]MDU9004348.1 alpha/beta hydrolase [Sedimentitalea todarodis]
MTNALIADRDRFAEQHPEQRIMLRGREWGYLDVGRGPTLMLIPGTLGRCDIFWQQITALSGRLRIIATSYPAGGGVADWAGDIVALMDHLDVAEATVLGSSLGGYLAQYIAGSASARVTRLVAANTLHSVRGLDQRPPYSLDLDTGPIADLRAGFGTGLEGWRAAHPDQSELVDLLLKEVGGRIPEAELRTRLSALKHAPDLPELDMANDRIITIEADDDPLIPAVMRAAVRERLKPDVAYRFLTGGHFPYIARPKAYTALLENVMEIDVTGPDWGAAPERVL